MIHKTGDINNENNYRGIAVMNTFSKILTTILTNRLNTWVECHNILPESQSGFRKRRSCNDNIFTLNATLQMHLRHSKKKLYGIFVDLKKAFDTVNHNLLWS